MSRGCQYTDNLGRIGSIVGSLLGGVLLGFRWAATTVYALVAIPATISAIALATLGIVRRRQRIG